MADDPAYIDRLAGQLATRRPDLLDLAEDELANLRSRMQIITRFIHNEAIAHDIRASLAHDLGLPQPTR